MLAKGGPRGWVAEARPGWRLAEGLRWPLPAPGGTAWGRRALAAPAAASQRHRLHSSLPLLLLKGHFLSPFWLTFTVLRDTALGSLPEPERSAAGFQNHHHPGGAEILNERRGRGSSPSRALRAEHAASQEADARPRIHTAPAGNSFICLPLPSRPPKITDGDRIQGCGVEGSTKNVSRSAFNRASL